MFRCLGRRRDGIWSSEPRSKPLWPCTHLRSPTHKLVLCNGPRPFSDMQRRHLFFFPPTSDSGKHSITCAVFQQPWPVLKYKVYHILDAKSLVSTPAWGDPEDKRSFPEWFIMLRLHYLAFWVWQNERPPPPPLASLTSIQKLILSDVLVRW